MKNTFSTCDLCDAQRDLPQAGFRVLPPVHRSYGKRTAFQGRVVTLRTFEDNTSVRELVNEPGLGRVLVVDAGQSVRRAVLGGNLAAAAAKQGWAGVLIDGAVRDVLELAVCDVGIFALACIPMATDKRHAGVRDIEVHVQGIAVRPNDWLYADADGIVIVGNVA